MSFTMPTALPQHHRIPAKWVFKRSLKFIVGAVFDRLSQLVVDNNAGVGTKGPCPVQGRRRKLKGKITAGANWWFTFHVDQIG